MQDNNEECTIFLRRIIAANKDRIDHYSNAIQLLDTDHDSNLILLFEKFSQQSQQFKAQLTPLLYREGNAEQPSGDSGSKVLNSRIDQQSTANRAALLKAFVQLELDFENIYQEIHTCNEIIEDQIKELITSQSKLLEKSQDDIASFLNKN